MMQLQPQASGDEMLWHAGMAFLSGILGSFLVWACSLLSRRSSPPAGSAGSLSILLRNLMFRAWGSTITRWRGPGGPPRRKWAATPAGASLLFFHGKAEDPKYFIENQRPGQNPHDDSSPGSRPARGPAARHPGSGDGPSAQAPPAHHRCHPHASRLRGHSAFLQEGPGDPEARVEDFHYHGPRPNTREQGIIMLADKVGAACALSKSPPPSGCLV